MTWNILPRPIAATYYFKDLNGERTGEQARITFAFWAMCPDRGLTYMTMRGETFAADHLHGYEVIAT